jgi:ATP/maltotriose-dependent transcriptional regulator MalT
MALNQGKVKEVQTFLNESLTLFQETGDMWNIALPLQDFGLIASQQGDYFAARELYEESLELSRAVEDTWHIAETLQRLGDLARIQGEYERANTVNHESLELWRRLGNKEGITETLNMLGEVALLQGNYEQAASLYMESLALLRILSNKRIIADVLHNLGKAAQHSHDDERAESLFRESLSLNAEIEYKPGITDCFVGLAAIAAAVGSTERAAQLLGAAEQNLNSIREDRLLTGRSEFEATLAAVRTQLDKAAFTTAFKKGRTLSFDQAIAYAQAQSPPIDQETPSPQPAPEKVPSAAYPGGLTRREVNVLHLVAQGLTDAQVADKLFISRRTVNGHLRSIYSKLGVSTRTAAVHFAVTHKLV